MIAQAAASLISKSHKIDLPLNFDSKSNGSCEVNVVSTNSLSIFFTSTSRNAFSLPKNVIIVYKN